MRTARIGKVGRATRTRKTETEEGARHPRPLSVSPLRHCERGQHAAAPQHRTADTRDAIHNGLARQNPKTNKPTTDEPVALHTG